MKSGLLTNPGPYRNSELKTLRTNLDTNPKSQWNAQRLKSDWSRAFSTSIGPTLCMTSIFRFYRFQTRFHMFSSQFLIDSVTSCQGALRASRAPSGTTLQNHQRCCRWANAQNAQCQGVKLIKEPLIHIDSSVFRSLDRSDLCAQRPTALRFATMAMEKRASQELAFKRGRHSQINKQSIPCSSFRGKDKNVELQPAFHIAMTNSRQKRWLDSSLDGLTYQWPGRYTRWVPSGTVVKGYALLSWSKSAIGTFALSTSFYPKETGWERQYQ